MKSEQVHKGTINFKHVMNMYSDVLRNNNLLKDYKLFAENKKEELMIIESVNGRHHYSFRKRKGYEETAQNKKAQKQLRSIDDILQEEISYASMYSSPKKILSLIIPFVHRTRIDIKKISHKKYEISFCSKKDITKKLYEAINS